MSAPGLVESAALMWPASTVEVARSRSAGAADGVLEYALLPSARDPRLAVPLRPKAAAAAVALGQSAPGSARAALRGRLMAAAFRSGAASVLLADRMRVHDGEPALDRHLSDLLGPRVSLGIRVGPPRANRKPVLQVVDAHGRLLAYAKLGTGPLTDQLVRDESATLSRLAGADLGEVRVPAVLHAGSWQDHPLLVLAPLPVHRAGAPESAAGAAALTAAMKAVARTGVAAGDLGVGALRDLPWWQRTCAAAGALPPGSAAGRLGDVRDVLAASGDRILAAGAWHGDWNAGNCSVVPGAVLVWDWERYGTGVPAGFDALHLRLQSALSAGAAAAPASALAAAARLVDDAAAITAPFGVEPGDAELVAALYLWGLGVRYATDDQDAAGSAVGRLDRWLLPVLEQITAAGRGLGATGTREH